MRRTQRERSETTRRKLVEATARCLVRDGYGGTSTTTIAREAGVSRGAQLHHYPTKADLVLATIRHVFEQRVDRFRATVEACGDVSLPGMIGPMWEAASAEEVFLPWLELTVAGRSDSILAGALEEVTREMRARTAEVAEELGAGSGAVVAFASALMDGLALQELAAPNPERRDQVLELLKTVATIVEDT